MIRHLSFEEGRKALVENTKAFAPKDDRITIKRRINNDVPRFLEDYNRFKREARKAKIIFK